MPNTVYIMMGLPGSGKSTLARKLVGEWFEGNIYSTDEYWYRPDGYYDFNINRIGQAHEWNFKRFSEFLHNATVIGVMSPLPDLVIDNTNLDVRSVKPYVDKAVQSGYNVELVEPDTEWRYDVDECTKRNTHRVPRETIANMLAKLQANRDAIASYIKEANGR